MKYSITVTTIYNVQTRKLKNTHTHFYCNIVETVPTVHKYQPTLYQQYALKQVCIIDTIHNMDQNGFMII